MVRAEGRSASAPAGKREGAMTQARWSVSGGEAAAGARAGGARWEPAESYPDPAIEILDPAFAKYRIFSAAVERVAAGCRWCEGPAWFGDGRHLLWSDSPNARILKWEEETGAVTVLRKPSNNANGNTRDRQGRLVTCEHGTRRVTRTESDGTLTVLIDRFEGKRLNSPNDVVVKSDGSIWFTDPPFGIWSNYEGHKAEPELHPNVYRIDGRTGQASLVADDMNAPNGICFTSDESKIYIVDSRATPHPLIRIYDVVADRTRLANRRIFYDGGEGTNPVGKSKRHTSFYLACGADAAPAIIFVHGWPELSISWRHQLPCSAGLGFHAIAPDMRGYGRSSTYARHEDYALEHAVQDMLELLDALGRDRAIWVGPDWGTPVASALASHHPNPCLR